MFRTKEVTLTYIFVFFLTKKPCMSLLKTYKTTGLFQKRKLLSLNQRLMMV